MCQFAYRCSARKDDQQDVVWAQPKLSSQNVFRRIITVSSTCCITELVIVLAFCQHQFASDTELAQLICVVSQSMKHSLRLNIEAFLKIFILRIFLGSSFSLYYHGLFLSLVIVGHIVFLLGPLGKGHKDIRKHWCDDESERKRIMVVSATIRIDNQAVAVPLLDNWRRNFHRQQLSKRVTFREILFLVIKRNTLSQRKYHLMIVTESSGADLSTWRQSMEPYFSALQSESALCLSLWPHDRGISAAGWEGPLLPFLIYLQSDSGVMGEGNITPFLIWVQKRTFY